MNNTNAFDSSKLLAGIIAITSTIIIFIFFLDVNQEFLGSRKYTITVKPDYHNWAWGVLTATTMFYYFILSKGKNLSGGYVHPIFSFLINLAQIMPIVGLVLSFYGKENQLAVFSYNFLSSIFVLFVFVHFMSGINSIREFVRK